MRGIEIIDVKSGVSKHTADDWDLIMSAKVIGKPAPRFVTVDMADRDGDLDHSEAMRGRVSYKNRALSFAFTCTAHRSTWAELEREITGHVHGKRVMIIDPDTPDYYYIGRCTLGEPTYKGGAIMFLEMTVNAEPFMLHNDETVVVRTVDAATSNNTIILHNDIMAVVPTITVSADMTIRFSSYSASLASGSMYKLPYLILEAGDNIVTVTSGSGTITFTYREGAI